jgi:MFS family permease
MFQLFKLIEIPVMLFAAVSFYFEWIFAAVLSVLIMGMLSSMYSPSKYGLIKDIGYDKDVSFGSGGFEMMAFLGILLGTVAASVISDYYSVALIFTVFLIVAVLGYVATNRIKVDEFPVDMTDDLKLDPVRFMINTFRFAKTYKGVNSSVLGASVFWLIGSLIQMNLIVHSQDIYHASNSQTGLVMGIAALGIAVGTFSAGVISGHKAKKGLVLVGISGMTVMLALLTFFQLNWFEYMLLVFLTTFSGGLFQIPHLSVVQNTDMGRKSGDIFAYLNMLTFILILVGAALFSLITFLTDENSRMVFASVLVVCVLTCLYFVFHSADYRNELRTDLVAALKRKRRQVKSREN